IEIDQPLAELRRRGIALICRDQHGLQGGGRLDRARGVTLQELGWHRIAAAREACEDGIPQSRRAIAGLGVTLPHIGPPDAQHALELAELARLKAAARLEAVAKRQELERRDRLENV